MSTEDAAKDFFQFLEKNAEEIRTSWPKWKAEAYKLEREPLEQALEPDDFLRQAETLKVRADVTRRSVREAREALTQLENKTPQMYLDAAKLVEQAAEKATDTTEKSNLLHQALYLKLQGKDPNPALCALAAGHQRYLALDAGFRTFLDSKVNFDNIFGSWEAIIREYGLPDFSEDNKMSRTRNSEARGRYYFSWSSFHKGPGRSSERCVSFFWSSDSPVIEYSQHKEAEYYGDRAIYRDGIVPCSPEHVSCILDFLHRPEIEDLVCPDYEHAAQNAHDITDLAFRLGLEVTFDAIVKWNGEEAPAEDTLEMLEAQVDAVNVRRRAQLKEQLEEDADAWQFVVD